MNHYQHELVSFRYFWTFRFLYCPIFSCIFLYFPWFFFIFLYSLYICSFAFFSLGDPRDLGVKDLTPTTYSMKCPARTNRENQQKLVVWFDKIGHGLLWQVPDVLILPSSRNSNFWNTAGRQTLSTVHHLTLSNNNQKKENMRKPGG